MPLPSRAFSHARGHLRVSGVLLDGPRKKSDGSQSRKNAHTIFVSFTSIEGTPLFIEKGHFSFVLEPRFNFHFCDTFNSTQNVTDNKEGCLVIKVYTNHDNDSFHNMEISTRYCREMVKWFFVYII